NTGTNQLEAGKDPNGMQTLVNVPTALATVQDMDVDRRKENKKATDMQDSLEVSKTPTGVQNASTKQLEEGKEPNKTQIPLDIQNASTVMKNGEPTTVINKSSLMDSRCQFRA
ncbi:unnamed protein product, partial [Rotaria sp. Silwood2]